MLLALATSHKLGLVAMAAVFIGFALASSFLLSRRNPDYPGRALGPFVGASGVLLVGMLTAVFFLAKEDHVEKAHGEAPIPAVSETVGTETSAAATTAGGGQATGGGEAAGSAAAGKQVFATAGCSGCHTLKAAGASGTVGPNLDEAKPSRALVVDRVTHGKGAMPSFKDQLSEQQIRDVAAFVSESAGT